MFATLTLVLVDDLLEEGDREETIICVFVYQPEDGQNQCHHTNGTTNHHQNAVLCRIWDDECSCAGESKP